MVHSDVTAFAQAILHGDEEHRAWLWEAALAFDRGDPIPAPRGEVSELRERIDLLSREIETLMALTKGEPSPWTV